MVSAGQSIAVAGKTKASPASLTTSLAKNEAEQQQLWIASATPSQLNGTIWKVGLRLWCLLPRGDSPGSLCASTSIPYRRDCWDFSSLAGWPDLAGSLWTGPAAFLESQGTQAAYWRGSGTRLPGAGGGRGWGGGQHPAPFPVFALWGPSTCFPLASVQDGVSLAGPTPRNRVGGPLGTSGHQHRDFSRLGQAPEGTSQPFSEARQGCPAAPMQRAPLQRADDNRKECAGVWPIQRGSSLSQLLGLSHAPSPTRVWA